MDFLTRAIFDQLIVVVIIVGAALAIVRLYADMTRPLPPDDFDDPPPVADDTTPNEPVADDTIPNEPLAEQPNPEDQDQPAD